MKNVKPLLLLGLLFIGLYSSCYKDSSGLSDIDLTNLPPEENITTSIYGRVIDVNDQPISNAVITLQSGMEEMIASTDLSGHFQFYGIEIEGKTAFMTIQSDGKFEAFRRMAVIADRGNYTEVKMKDKTIIGSVNATQGGTVDNGNGAEIKLPANGVVTSSGSSYDGEVSVAMTWIDPTAPDLATQMVGDLSAIDKDGNEKALATYGMLQVELLDDVGNELQLASGSTAELQFPVPAEIQGNAPTTIPLWSYDEELGTWIEEGEATFQNGVYRGEVSHFSSWNVDVAMDPIEVKGQVKIKASQESVDVGFLSIYVESDAIGRKGGWLCDDGHFTFYNFPKGEEFNLSIFDNCGQLLFTKDYGPYEQNVDLGIIEVELTSQNKLIRIKGNAITCEGDIVSNGIIKVQSNNRQLIYDIGEDGAYDFAIDVCAEGLATFWIVDQTNDKTNEGLVVDASKLEWNFPEVELCRNARFSISVSIEGHEPIGYTGEVHSRGYLDGNGLDVYDFYIEFPGFGVPQSPYRNSRMSFKIESSGSEIPRSIPLLNFDLLYVDAQYSMDGEGDIIATITMIDEDSAIIEGSLSGFVTGRSILVADPWTMPDLEISANFSFPLP